MRSSPSQCETFERCNRAWWFQKARGLYAPSTVSQAFGTALHELCAAALSGQEPPPTWASEVTEAEARMAERMVATAVERKILVHRPGLWIEHAFIMDTPHGQQSGRIDCLDPNGILEDHKSSSSERWLKTAADLRENLQMMTYAGYFLSKFKVPRVWLRHNQFVTSDGTVTFTEVAVTPDEVRDFWRRRLLPIMAAQGRTLPLPQWTDVPGHEPKSEACQAYDGCPYAVICHSGVAIEDWTPPGPKSDVPF